MFIDSKDQKEALELLSELLELDEGLSSWEIGFITTLDEWDGHFSILQYEALREVHRNHL